MGDYQFICQVLLVSVWGEVPCLAGLGPVMSCAIDVDGLVYLVWSALSCALEEMLLG